MKYLFLISLTLILFACKQDEIPTQPSGWEYAGIFGNNEDGKISGSFYKIYRVEERSLFTESYTLLGDTDVVHICTTNVCVMDTNVYYVKELVSGKILDLEGDSAFVIERYYSANKSDFSLSPDSVWTAKFKHNQFIRTENNTKYAKLTFPISTEVEWDINAYNNLGNDLTTYTNLRTQFTVDDQTFNNVIEVEIEYNAENDTLVRNALTDFFSIEKEYYAPSVGLVYGWYSNYENGQSDGSFWSNDVFVATTGYEKYVELIEYKF